MPQSIFGKVKIALAFRNGHRERNQEEPAPNRFIDAAQPRPMVTRDEKFELRRILKEILAHEARLDFLTAR